MFANLRGKAQKVLEIGIGTGPNLKYYAGDEGMNVYGVDPNPKMEKYAREAAHNAGLPLQNFEFKQAVWHFVWSLLKFLELFIQVLVFGVECETLSNLGKFDPWSIPVPKWISNLNMIG